jgi:hypothetical protein
MSSWTPGEWGMFFVSAGGFVTVIAAQIANMVVSIRNGRKADVNAAKIDANTEITQATHAAVVDSPPTEKP